MVYLGKGEEVHKFILGVGDLMYKIRALLYLSTEENNVNEENGSVVFNGFYRDINEINKSLNSDDQHYVKKITTLTFCIIWKLFITCAKATYQSKLIFWLYLGLWSLYGVFYHTNEATKMLGYNILDLIAKAFVGIFFWLYLTKSVLF